MSIDTNQFGEFRWEVYVLHGILYQAQKLIRRILTPTVTHGKCTSQDPFYKIYQNLRNLNTRKFREVRSLWYQRLDRRSPIAEHD